MKNVLVTLTGPSGSGKSTLEGMLKRKGFLPLISHTTRPMRDGEVNGQNYHFVTEEKFETLSRSGAFVEEVEFNGNRYAMSKSEILKLEESSSPGVIVVEPHGKEQIAEFAKHNDVRTLKVFIDIDPVEQMRRLLERFTADIHGLPMASEFTPASLYEARSRLHKVQNAYASRLVAVMTTERTWVADAYSEAIPNERYDMLIHGFNKDTEQIVIERIMLSVDMMIMAPKRDWVDKQVIANMA